MPLGGHNHREIFQQGTQYFNIRLKIVMRKESIASFSRSCNIHPSTIRKYLNTNALPSIDKVEAIAAYTGCSLEWLITGKGDTELVRAQTKKLSQAECDTWWKMILDALSHQQKEHIIYTFQQGGLNAIFKLTDTNNKSKVIT